MVCAVTQDWLLVETLGDEPVVVAQGRQMKNFVPLGTFLRRNPSLDAIGAAIADAVASGTSVTAALPHDRVLTAEPVVMSDGVVHGVQVWYGPAGTEAPERPLIGAWSSDVALEGSATPQFLINLGKDPAVEPLTGRAIADDIPASSFNEGEAQALSWVVDLMEGRTLAANWGFHDRLGAYRRVGFCVRMVAEPTEDGGERLLGRSMNLIESVSDSPAPAGPLAERLVDSMGRAGVHRAIIDLNTWTLIKWLDEPCEFYDWRAEQRVHPEDFQRHAAPMTAEFGSRSTSAVLRLPANGGGWTPVHVTIDRIELDSGIFAGLIALREPTDDETAAAGFGIGSSSQACS